MKNMKALVAVLVGAITLWSVTAYAGNVVKIVKEDNYVPEYVETKYNAELQKFHYQGTVAGPGIVKPTGGKIGQFLIENIKLTMKEGEFNSGGIDTEELGKVRILFSSSLSSLGFIALLTDEQLMEWVKLVENTKKK